MNRTSLFRRGSLRWSSLLSLVVAFGVMAVPQSVLSMDQNEVAEISNTVTGSFDGLDLKQRRIWISDMVYLLGSSVDVQGTSSKLGLITDLKQGEIIKAYLKENDADIYVPYVIKIERQ